MSWWRDSGEHVAPPASIPVWIRLHGFPGPARARGLEPASVDAASGERSVDLRASGRSGGRDAVVMPDSPRPTPACGGRRPCSERGRCATNCARRRAIALTTIESRREDAIEVDRGCCQPGPLRGARGVRPSDRRRPRPRSPSRDCPTGRPEKRCKKTVIAPMQLSSHRDVPDAEWPRRGTFHSARTCSSCPS